MENPDSLVPALESVAEFYIDTPTQLADFIDLADTQNTNFYACSIDTEADSMHVYETKLCLIQFSTPNALAIIDPLSLDHEALAEFTRFVDRFDLTWMHGADYDISLLKSTLHWVPKQIYDTQIAARLLGVEKFGLADLLGAEYGIEVSKQSQKADWSQRPLSKKMLAYAYNDVRYLIDLGDRYLRRLKACARDEWFLQSCFAARDAVLNRNGRSEDELWRVNGWGKLSRRGLHFLKHIWLWRDKECRRLNRPAFKFLGNREILELADQMDKTGSMTPPRYLRPPYALRLHETVSSVRDVDPDHYPEKSLRTTGPRLEIDEKKFECLRERRNHIASELGIDPTVITTRTVIEKLVAKNFPSEEAEHLLLPWQRHLLLP